MAGDPLVGIVMGFASLISGVVELGDKMDVSTNSSYRCHSRSESRYERSENISSNKWMYITCSEYQRYLADVKKRSGTLLVIR
ncbi:MAG: hypothetical protein WCI72_01840 [archaeon]